MISMQILITDIWSSFCRMTELIIQIQRPWKASEMPLPLYKWHHKRQLIYVPPKKQSTKNNCRLYNNLVGIIFGSAWNCFQTTWSRKHKEWQMPIGRFRWIVTISKKGQFGCQKRFTSDRLKLWKMLLTTRTEGETQNSAAGKPQCVFVNYIISVPDNTYNVLIF